MLGKLMKYEFKASGRILMPLYAGILVMAVLSGIFTKASSNIFDIYTVYVAHIPKFISFISTISILLYVILIMTGLILSYIVAIIRFKRNLLGAEGYLMNTLPVTPSQNITAKTLVAVVYQILGMLVSAVSVLIFAIICIDNFAANFTDLFKVLGAFIAEAGVGSVTAFVLESVVLAILCFFCGNLIFYAAISIGHSANLHRVAKSIVAYILLYIAGQIISFNIISIAARIIPITDSMLSIHIILIGTAALEAVYASAYFAITHYFLKNKLNLQ